MTTLDIVIVNWNAGEQIQECLNSINDVKCTTFNIGKVVVVDNNSTDNSIALISNNRYEYNLSIIKNDYNAGFGKACNQGAAKCESEYILFLNPDTKLFNDSLDDVMLFCQKQHNKLGVTGIQLVDEKGDVGRTCRYFPKKRNRIGKITGLTRIFPSLSNEMLTWDHNDLKEVDQIMGAFFIVQNKVFKELEGFDEQFFVYYEEVDLCKRIQEQGYKNYFYPYSKAFHQGGGTSNQVKDMRLFYSLRSWLKYEKKHNGKLAAFMALFIELSEYISRFVYLLAKRRPREIRELNRAYKLLLKNLKEVF
ncbi:glycosyltransferase family 2 protein [Bacillus mycoides]